MSFDNHYDDDPADSAVLDVAALAEEAPATPAEEAQPEEAQDTASEDTEADEVTLVLGGAFFVREYRTETAEGATLVFDRSGTSVPAEDADTLIADAAANGVTLLRKDA